MLEVASHAVLYVSTMRAHQEYSFPLTADSRSKHRFGDVEGLKVRWLHIVCKPSVTVYDGIMTVSDLQGSYSARPMAWQPGQ
jgi:hypothetical protein